MRLRLSWGRLRSSENAAYRRGLAFLKPPAGLGFPPYGRRLACPWWRWGCVSLGVYVWCGVCGVLCVPSFCSRRRCAIQNENPISESIGKNREQKKRFRFKAFGAFSIADSDSSSNSVVIPFIFVPKASLGATFWPKQNFEKLALPSPHRGHPPIGSPLRFRRPPR